jgi:folylpolyglutamate synthase/dihydropteroate synthase
MLNAAAGGLATSLADAREALPAVRLPGRFQRVGPYIFDVAHNPTVRRCSPPRSPLLQPPSHVRLSLRTGDKDWRGVMTASRGVADVFVLTDAPTAPASRAWSREAAASYARDQGGTSFQSQISTARCRVRPRWPEPSSSLGPSTPSETPWRA